MSLEEKVMTGMKLAIKTKQANDLRALRAIKAAILSAKTGTSTMKDMGEVIGMASKEFTGRADNSKVSSLIRSVLA